MVRVAGLKQQMEAGVIELSSDGLTPSEQLLAIRQVALELMQEDRRCLQQLLPLLTEAGIHILDYQALTGEQRTAANDYFEQVVFPVLTPLAFDPGRPFPYISNMSMNLAVLIRDQFGRERFATPCRASYPSRHQGTTWTARAGRRPRPWSGWNR
jgi:polyphosphate kinase